MFTTEKKALTILAEKLKSLLKDNLIALIGFGSRVRGDFTDESDFDVLIVIRDKSPEVFKETIEIVSDIEELYEIPLSAVVKSLATFELEKKLNSSFYRNIQREGIVIYGKA